jgi:hypothetical protein
MKQAIAIAKTKIRTRFDSRFNPGTNETEISQHATRAWLSIFLITGAVIGFGGFSCMLVGLFNSGGIANFFTGWLTSITVF